MDPKHVCQNESVLFCGYIYQLIHNECSNVLTYLVILVWIIRALYYCYTSLAYDKQLHSSETFFTACKEFEKKASQTVQLFNLHLEAAQLLNVFKSNINIIFQQPLHATKWSGESNTIYKMVLYEGEYIDIKVHVFSQGFEETSYHNHSQHMLLCNLSGDYFHTTWNINYNKSGVLYKFKHEKGGRTSKAETINGTLEYIDCSNYKPGNWRCLHPSSIHTIKSGLSNQKVISFIIRSKLDQNKDRFILSKEPKLQIKPESNGNVYDSERLRILQCIVSAVQ